MNTSGGVGHGDVPDEMNIHQCWVGHGDVPDNMNTSGLGHGDVQDDRIRQG